MSKDGPRCIHNVHLQQDCAHCRRAGWVLLQGNDGDLYDIEKYLGRSED